MKNDPVIVRATSSSGLKTSTTVSGETDKRSWFEIENQDLTNVLYVKLGTGAGAADYDKPLKTCTAAADGTGGTWVVPGYRGAISCYSAGTPSYTFTEFIE